MKFFKAKLDRDDGRRVYDVEFYSGSREYDYEIDAATGDIVSFDFDVEGYIAGSTQSDADIGADKAKSIALADAGVSESNALGLRVKQDWDDGMTIYEVEFRSGRYEYEYEIDAATGEILSYDYDAEGYSYQQRHPRHRHHGGAGPGHRPGGGARRRGERHL